MSEDENLFGEVEEKETKDTEKSSLERQKNEILNRAKKDSEASLPENDTPATVEVNEIGGDTNLNFDKTSLEDRVETRILENEMQTSYLNYAMSVIVSRALPDVRDGLKPVHRRIFYAMHKLGLTPGAKYVKCARVVGDVLGKYHPHGDASVYNAMARMAQDFSLRYPMIDGQGNFGSIDGDPPAAMRYTEARLDKPAVYLLSDIEKDTVDFVDNYDGSFQEPTVLPTILPNLLINGQTGIAVGMATEIPPHNLVEVCQALLALAEDPEITIEGLMEYIKGPDFPTGGIIYGKADILKAYQTGRGRCLLRSKAEVTENSIIVSEIPYQINKSNLLIKIASLVSDKTVEGIRDIRDESNKDGIRIVIETKRDATPEVVLNQLYNLSELQVYSHFNLLALVNRGRQPKTLNLKEILVEFLAHRDEVVIRRTKFDLNKAEAELHILDGLKIALDFIDEVIVLIRASYDKEEAAKKLQERFSLSDKQTEAILQMRLQTLTNLDKQKIEDERQQKIDLIAKLREILDNPEVKKALMIGEIQEVAEKFKSPRRTQVIEYNLNDYNKEDFIEDEEVLVQLTAAQYLKVTPVVDFRQQGRGGRGVSSFSAREDDFVKTSFVANSHDYVYAFTDLGRVFRTRVFDLPSGSRTGRGQSLVNYFQLQENEKITNLLAITKDQEANQEGSLIFTTKKGLVKQTKLELFANVRKTGIIAIGLNEDDNLLDVKISLDVNDKLVLSATNGKTVIFGRSQISALGRTAKGVKGIKLKGKDEALSLQISNLEFQEATPEDKDVALLESDSKKTLPKEYPSILVITEKGFGKQTKLSDYRQTNRAAGGVKTLNMTTKTGAPVLVQIMYGNEEDLILTTKNGITIKIDPNMLSQLGRNTQGVKVIKLEAGDKVVSGSVY